MTCCSPSACDSHERILLVGEKLVEGMAVHARELGDVGHRGGRISLALGHAGSREQNPQAVVFGDLLL